jgi:hypothetical protein
MDNYEVKEATPHKVRFSITPEGEVKFDAQGLSEWEAEALINQVATQAREQRSATQKIREIKFTSELMMHCTAIAFVLVVVSGCTFTVSRLISTAVHQYPEEIYHAK